MGERTAEIRGRLEALRVWYLPARSRNYNPELIERIEDDEDLRDIISNQRQGNDE